MSDLNPFRTQEDEPARPTTPEPQPEIERKETPTVDEPPSRRGVQPPEPWPEPGRESPERQDRSGR